MSDQDDSPPSPGVCFQNRSSDRISLEDGTLTVEIAPLSGGSFTQFYMTTGKRRIDLFRQADETAIDGLLPLGAACFPMVPYAGRLRGGTFQYQSRRITFPLGAFSEPHSSHGDGWMRPWEVSRHSRQLAVMTLIPVPDPPFRYRCRQVIRLTKNGLHVRTRIWNDENVAMPVGLGLHPYFPRRGGPTLTAKLPQRWLLDRELMPIELRDNELSREMAAGAAISSLPAQSEFWNWDGMATLNWPTEGVSLTIRTEPSLNGAVLWAPQGKDFFCFEPISHSTDAFNSAEHAATSLGVVTLEPGAQYKQDIYFDLSSTAA